MGSIQYYIKPNMYSSTQSHITYPPLVMGQVHRDLCSLWDMYANKHCSALQSQSLRAVFKDSNITQNILESILESITCTPISNIK